MDTDKWHSKPEYELDLVEELWNGINCMISSKPTTTMNKDFLIVKPSVNINFTPVMCYIHVNYPKVWYAVVQTR